MSEAITPEKVIPLELEEAANKSQLAVDGVNALKTAIGIDEALDRFTQSIEELASAQ